MRTILNTKTYHKAVIAIAVLLSIASAISIGSLRFNYDFEAFFPNQDNELELYESFRKTYEYDNEFVLIALENNKGIFQRNFLIKVDSFAKALAKIPFVKRVQSPTNLKKIKYGGLAPVQLQQLHFNDTLQYKTDSAEIYANRFLVGSFFSSDGQSVSIYLKTDDILSKKKSDLIADSINSLLKSFSFDNSHVVGRIFAQQVYLKNIQKEFIVFLCLAFVLVVISLWLMFRKLYSVVLPVVIVLTAILWTLGSMALLNKPIDIMAIMLPTMIFVAGMSDVVHFFSRYFEEKAKGTNEKEIYKLILKEVGFPTFLTLLTTVVGFLSLLFSSIQPIKDFGIFTSIGVTFAFLLSYTLLPALLYFFHPKNYLVQNSTDAAAHRWLSKLLIWVLRHKMAVAIVTLTLCGLAFVGVSQIKINNVLLEDLSEKEKIKQDFNFLDNKFSGVRPLELQIDFADSTQATWSYDHLKLCHQIDSFVIKEYDAGFLLSPAELSQQAFETYNDTVLKRFITKTEYEDVEELLLQNLNNKEVKRLYSAKKHAFRISAKIKDMGSLIVKQHNQALLSFCNKQFGQTAVVHITGAAHLLDRNNDYMVSNMSQGFVFSLVIIALLTFLLHRNIKMVLVFLLPNIVPLLLIAGIMGFFGIELKAATSLVFSIAFGIATDDTIHFISRLKIELSYGKSMLYALKRTYLETGKPILLTTLILVGGFMSLMTSNFESTFYFGFLICITVIIALVADLFLLPVLLVSIYGGKK